MKKIISINELKTNMIISSDVVNKNGATILSAGFEILDEVKIATTLRCHGIFEVEIECEELEGINEEFVVDLIYKDEPQLKEIKEFKNVMNNMMIELKEKFDLLEKGARLTKDDLYEGVLDLLKVCRGNTNIFQLLEKVKYIDDYIYLHSYSVAFISYILGKWLDFDENQLSEVVIAAIFSDLGKIKLDEDILNKCDKLTNLELKHVQNHVLYSYSIIKNHNYISDEIKKGVLFHHEREDGSGYPRAVKGDNIPLYAKVIAIADIYSAITSKRSYRDRKTPFEAIYILENEYMDKLDPNILLIFIARIKDVFIGNKVKLTNDKIGEILFIPKQDMYRPIIKVDDTGEIIDLSKSTDIKIDIFY